MESAAVDAGFTAFGRGAFYVPPEGGPRLAVTVIASRDDVAAALDARALTLPRGQFDVRAAEIARPRKGGLIELGAARWRIADEPQAVDPERLIWRLSCALERASAPGAVV